MTTIAGKLSRFTQKEIDAFFASSRCTLKSKGLVFLVAPRQNVEYSRILVITSRKVGNSPTRNKIRRQFKALFYESGYYKQNHDCVIIVRKEATALTFTALKILLDQAMAPVLTEKKTSEDLPTKDTNT